MKLHNAANIRIIPALAFLALALLLLHPGEAWAASAKSYFTKGHAEFYALVKNSRRAKYRSNWDKVARQFSNCLKASPTGDYAPKALYYLGRTHEELGKHSGLKSDFRDAVDYYSRVISRYPDHGWTDDCLFMRANIYSHRLRENTKARLDLATIIMDYPRGDMHAKAKAELKNLGKYDWAIAQVSKKSPVPVIHKTTPKNGPIKTGGTSSKSSGSSRLTTVRYTSSDDYTRVVLEMDAPVKFRYQMLAPNPSAKRPHRLYIDLEGSVLGTKVDHSTSVADGILRSIRAAQYNKETTRVVLDFLAMQDYKIFPLQNPYRVVVDVYAPDKKDQEVAAAQAALAARKAEDVHKTPATSDYRPPKGSKRMAGSLLEQLGLTVRTVMIDAGHGGKDPGAMANGLREKDINLAFAKRLGGKLQAAGFNVIYTRTTDVFIPLEKRTAMANAQKADLFISIHCNAHRNRRINGIETYSLNLAKTNAAVRIAARENAVDPRSISDLQFILTDLMVNSKIKESKDLASDVQSNVLIKVHNKYTLKDMGTREAPFYVLMGAKMPSILVELGYITNMTESKRLNSKAYQEYLANGIVAGVKAYKSKIERYAMN